MRKMHHVCHWRYLIVLSEKKIFLKIFRKIPRKEKISFKYLPGVDEVTIL